MNVTYFTRSHMEDETKEITKEKARYYLDGCYKKKFIDEVIDGGKAFRLQTPYRDIWTKDEKGRVPMPGFYGICE